MTLAKFYFKEFDGLNEKLGNALVCKYQSINLSIHSFQLYANT